MAWFCNPFLQIHAAFTKKGLLFIFSSVFVRWMERQSGIYHSSIYFCDPIHQLDWWTDSLCSAGSSSRFAMLLYMLKRSRCTVCHFPENCPFLKVKSFAEENVSGQLQRGGKCPFSKIFEVFQKIIIKKSKKIEKKFFIILINFYCNLLK
jgi:hypothetical protein